MNTPQRKSVFPTSSRGVYGPDARTGTLKAVRPEERTTARSVHARDPAEDGYLEAYEPLTPFTGAAPLQAADDETPLGSRSVEGNRDLVGRTIPVFLVHDAMNIHAVKPRSHAGMPQAAAAHDTSETSFL